MQKQYRLRKNRDFQRVYRRGKSYPSRYMVLLVQRSVPGRFLCGFSVSKKIGNSVMRSKVKRRLKENLRLVIPQLKKGYSVVIIARESAAKADYHQLGKAMRYLLHKADLYQNSEAKQGSRDQ